MAIDENKQKALAAALGQIEKQFGKGSIMRLGAYFPYVSDELFINIAPILKYSERIW